MGLFLTCPGPRDENRASWLFLSVAPTAKTNSKSPKPDKQSLPFLFEGKETYPVNWHFHTTAPYFHLQTREEYLPPATSSPRQCRMNPHLHRPTNSTSNKKMLEIRWVKGEIGYDNVGAFGTVWIGPVDFCWADHPFRGFEQSITKAYP